MPKLAYRKHGPNDKSGLVMQESSSSTSGKHNTEHSGHTLLINPASAPQSPVGTWGKPGTHQTTSPLPSPRSAQSEFPPSVKKKSLFSGIFAAKEPSMAAFDHMKMLEANHPNLKSYTSQRKLPADAPKVASKWDGMPKGYQKEKEKEKHAPKLSPDNPSQSLGGPPTSTGRSDDSKRERRLSASTTGSHSSRSRGMTRDTNSTYTTQHGNPSGSSGISSSRTDSISGDSDTRDTGAKVRAEFLTSPSLPDLTSYFPEQPHDIQNSASKAPELKDTRGPQSHLPAVDRRLPHPLPTLVEPVGSASEHSSSSTCYLTALPPIESAPIEGVRIPTPKVKELLSSPRTVVSKDVPATVQPLSPSTRAAPAGVRRHPTADGFLAGEARPFELLSDEESAVSEILPQHRSTQHRPDVTTSKVSRPDDLEKRPSSSRNGLGIGASARKPNSSAHNARDGTRQAVSSKTAKSSGLTNPSKLGLFNSSRGGS